MSEETPPIIKSQMRKPCGCIITELSNETTQMSPCVPCGMMEAARALASVGQILAAVATRMRVERDSTDIDVAVKKSLES